MIPTQLYTFHFIHEVPTPSPVKLNYDLLEVLIIVTAPLLPFITKCIIIIHIICYTIILYYNMYNSIIRDSTTRASVV